MTVGIFLPVQFFEEARHCEQWMARHTELLQNRFARDNIPVEQAELLIHELQVSWPLSSPTYLEVPELGTAFIYLVSVCLRCEAAVLFRPEVGHSDSTRSFVQLAGLLNPRSKCGLIKI